MRPILPGSMHAGRSPACLVAIVIGMANVVAGTVASTALAQQNAPAATPSQTPSVPPAPPDVLRNNGICFQCHGNPNFSALSLEVSGQPLYVDQAKFAASVHGTMLDCVDCHTDITAFPHKPVTLSPGEWRQSIPRMCGKCHGDELKTYLTSIHGRQVNEEGNPWAAVCSDCHTAHAIATPSAVPFRVDIINRCGTCHVDQLKSYLNTYHGQTTLLGYGSTAKCFDCHGGHTIQRVDDPRASVSPQNRLTTCRQCHANATPGFVTFQPHATTTDFARYPREWLASKFMALLLGGTLSFFWLHSGLWWLREYRHQREGRLTTHVQVTSLDLDRTVHYSRWAVGWRIAHCAFAVVVIIQVFTGMTLFYADSWWGPAVSGFFGGPQVTGVIHRIFAVAFVSIFLGHLVYVLGRIGRNWRSFRWFGPYSMLPNFKDFEDAYHMFRWFFGLGPKPDFDKWTYWEKFDYWAPFWGVTIIGVSGAMLWFNTFTASILPGWVFNVATIFHGEEAFLAAGFLFTVHFFNNHWRPENFPLDILMLTGSMPLERFRREHSIEYDRLVRTGQLEQYLVQAPSPPMQLRAKIIGYTLMALGLMLLVLILSGFVQSLTEGVVWPGFMHQLLAHVGLGQGD